EQPVRPVGDVHHPLRAAFELERNAGVRHRLPGRDQMREARTVERVARHAQLPGGEDILAETVADAAVARLAYKLLRDAAARRQLQPPAGGFAPEDPPRRQAEPVQNKIEG